MPQHDDAHAPRLLQTVAPDAAELAWAHRRRSLIIAVIGVAGLSVALGLWLVFDGVVGDDAIELTLGLVLGAVATFAVLILSYEYPRLVWHPPLRRAIEREHPGTQVWSCTPVSGVRQLARMQSGGVLGVRGLLSVGPQGLCFWGLDRGGPAVRLVVIPHERIVSARWEHLVATVSTGQGAVVRYRDDSGTVWELKSFVYRGELWRGGRRGRELLAALGFDG